MLEFQLNSEELLKENVEIAGLAVGGTSVSSEAGGRSGTHQGSHRNCQNEPGFPPIAAMAM